MTFKTSPEPVISGVPYPVTEVDGAPAQALSAFVGAVEITIDKRGTPYVIEGEGRERGDLVRVHEKNGKGGKDVRVWSVSAAPDGGFVAETVV
ncbi:hypothetical protein [uncultured Cellulomonas sp.]|uniref:hypothetical protein n=1 Tax=uncultured Cellulomonas sp. TaxID=189682 RepID=UPI00261B162B|nr:hypothetical protein [uncultured Cellulomonas sp.]